MIRSGSVPRLFRVADASFDANCLVPNRCSHRRRFGSERDLQHGSAVVVFSAAG